MKTVFKNRRLWRGLGITALVLLVIGIGGTALVSSDYIRGRVMGGLGDRLGREVAVDGPFNIDWDWGRTHVTAEKLRIANVDAAEEKNMLEIARLDMRVKIWPLLWGDIDIPQMTLDHPRLVLEKYDEDRNNWTFLPLTAAGNVKEAVVPDSRGEMPQFGYMKINEGEIVYRDAPRKLNVDLQLDAARGSEKKESDTFSFSGKGELDGKALVVKGRGGSLDMLRDSSADYPLQLDIEMDGTTVGVDGTFRDPVNLAGLNAQMNLSGPNLADLFHLTHIPLPPTPQYALTGQLIKNSDIWQFNKFDGKVGKSDLSGDVKYDTGRERALLSGAVTSHRMDIDDLSGFIGYTPRDKPANGRVLPDVPINLTRLRASDIDLTLRAEQLNAPGWPLRDMLVRFNLDNGLLKADPLKFGVAGGTVDGSVVVNGRDDVPDTTIALDLKHLSLKQFLTSAKLGDMTTGLFGGRIRLQGKGKTLADMLAASDGRITLVMTGGRVSLAAVEAADLDIAELVPLLMGEDRTTELRCAAGDFAVNKGKLNSRVFVVDTGDTKFNGDANINLKNENLDIRIDAKPKDGSVLSLQSDILVGGTFKNPDVGIDPASAGLRGGAAAGLALLAPIAAILPFVEFGNAHGVDCDKLMQKAEAGNPAQPPKPDMLRDKGDKKD